MSQLLQACGRQRNMLKYARRSDLCCLFMGNLAYGRSFHFRSFWCARCQSVYLFRDTYICAIKERINQRLYRARFRHAEDRFRIATKL